MELAAGIGRSAFIWANRPSSRISMYALASRSLCAAAMARQREESSGISRVGWKRLTTGFWVSSGLSWTDVSVNGFGQLDQPGRLRVWR